MRLPASGEGVLARTNLIYVGPLDEEHRVQRLATGGRLAAGVCLPSELGSIMNA